MEDSWLEKEEFNFDVPLSPLHDENKDAADNDSKAEDLDEDEVFFGPVGVMERCAAAVAEKDKIKPLEPLCPQQQPLLLKDSIAAAIMHRHKPLSLLQNKSPVAIVYPMTKREPSELTLQHTGRLKSKFDVDEGAKENKENSVVEKSKAQRDASIHSEKTSENILKRSSFITNQEAKKLCKTDPANQQSKLGSSLDLGKPKPRGIPRMIDNKLKTTRPSSIPSFKPGLVTGQPKLRGTSCQDSKLKPLKATHSQAKTSSVNEAEKASKNTKLFGIRNVSIPNSVSTPVSKDHKRSRSSTGEIPQRRKSNAMASSLTKLSFPNPTNNSTPLKPNGASSSLKMKSSIVTPRRSIGNISAISAKDRITPKNGRPMARRSLLPMQLKSTQDESPEIQPIANKRRNSNIPCSMTKDKNQFDIESNVVLNCSNFSRSFVLDDANKNIEVQDLVTDAPIKIEKLIDHVAAATPEQNAFKERDEQKATIEQPIILVPEAAAKHQSPLLKFDSPVVKQAMPDPFATGDTPPRIPQALLLPEQIQKDLIEW